MKYLSVGTLIVNNVHFVDGSKIENILGGGLFAHCGLLQYSDSSLMVMSAGLDYEKYFGKWMSDNNVSSDGIVIRGEWTMNTNLQYFEDGKWEEVSIHGKEYSIRAFGVNYIFANDIEKYIADDTKGIYIYGDIDKAFFDFIGDIRKKYGVKVMEELPTRECSAENYDRFKEYVLPNVDIYSLNKPESFALFSVETVEEAIDVIKELGVPCYYRVGKKGAYMIMNGEAAFMPSVAVRTKEEEIDPTGCGNSSTATALVGFCEGEEPLMIAAMAAVTAGHMVLQNGPYPSYKDEDRARARDIATKIYLEQKNLG